MSTLASTAAYQRLATATAAVGGALAVANLLAYVVNVVASRTLGPAQYGQLASLLGVVLVGSVAGLAAQAVSARRVASAPHSPIDSLMRGALLLAFTVGGVVVAGSWPLQQFLHLPSVLGPLLVAGVLVPLTLCGYIVGIAQGQERYGATAGLLVAQAVCRLVPPVLVLLGGGGVLAALAAMAVGTCLGLAVSFALLPDARAHVSRGAGGSIPELVHASNALLALYVLTTIDLLLARHFLDPTEAGEYAVGTLITKVAVWAPSFVLVIALPRLSRSESRIRARRVSAVVIGIFGLVVTATVALAPDLVVELLGGSEYAGLAPYAWWFAGLGSLYAQVQLVVLARIAREQRRTGLTVWTAVWLEIVIVATLSPDELTTIVGCALAVAAAVLLHAAVTTHRRPHV